MSQFDFGGTVGCSLWGVGETKMPKKTDPAYVFATASTFHPAALKILWNWMARKVTSGSLLTNSTLMADGAIERSWTRLFSCVLDSVRQANSLSKRSRSTRSCSNSTWRRFCSARARSALAVASIASVLAICICWSAYLSRTADDQNSDMVAIAVTAAPSTSATYAQV